MAIKIAVTNQKGGVGKTTTAVALATGLHNLGKKVLLIDLDPQCNSTDTMNGVIEDKETLIDCFEGNSTIKNAVQHTAWGDLLPCDELLENADVRYVQKLSAPFMLQDLLVDVENEYDYIIMDTTPYRGILLSNALVVANELIIPISLERYSMQGLSQLKDTIDEVKKRFNPDLHVLGILATRVRSNTKVSKSISELMPKVAVLFDSQYFSAFIPESTKCPESITEREPLLSYAPNSAPAQAYMQLVNEIISLEG